MENNESQNTTTKYIIIIFTGIILCLSIFYIITGNSQNKLKEQPIVSIKPHNDFSAFTRNWNNIVRQNDLKDRYQLNSIDSLEVLKQLKQYITYYNQPLSESMKKNITDLTHQYPNSIWDYYAKFLQQKTLPTTNIPDYDSLHSSKDLYSLIQTTTGNHDVEESIIKLLSSTGPCNFFKFHKYDLWEIGLSHNFKKCNSDILDAKKYPSLIPLLNR